jgi:hypothetical protein
MAQFVSARGWRRLILVLGIAWIPVGYFWGCSEGAHESDWATADYSICLNEARNEAEQNKCDTDLTKDMALYNKYDPEMEGIFVIVVGEIALLLAWFCLWVIWRVGRWVYGGFIG